MTESENIHARLDEFTGATLARGRSRFVEAMWILVRSAIFLSSIPWPTSLKVRVLRAFGATVGRGLYLRPRVYIHFPWKLYIGDHCWIGERCEILNLESFTMESHSALAHDVYIATGGHDVTSRTMAYANAPVRIETGSWVATRATILPGVTIHRNTVVAAGAVVNKTFEGDSILGGVPARIVAPRRIDKD